METSAVQYEITRWNSIDSHISRGQNFDQTTPMYEDVSFNLLIYSYNVNSIYHLRWRWFFIFSSNIRSSRLPQNSLTLCNKIDDVIKRFTKSLMFIDDDVVTAAITEGKWNRNVLSSFVLFVGNIVLAKNQLILIENVDHILPTLVHVMVKNYMHPFIRSNVHILKSRYHIGLFGNPPTDVESFSIITSRFSFLYPSRRWRRGKKLDKEKPIKCLFSAALLM